MVDNLDALAAAIAKRDAQFFSNLHHSHTEYEQFRQAATNLVHMLNTAARITRSKGTAFRVYDCVRITVAEQEGEHPSRDAYSYHYSVDGCTVHLVPTCIRDSIGIGRIEVKHGTPSALTRWRLYARIDGKHCIGWSLFDTSGQSPVRPLQLDDLIELLGESVAHNT